MEFVHFGEGTRHRPPAPNAPTVEVLFGGESDGPSVGFLRVHIPPGAAMGEHAHGGSDVVVAPAVGEIIIRQGDTETTVGVGDAVLIHKEEWVGVSNAGDITAEVLVAAGPANFVSGVRSWPTVE